VTGGPTILDLRAALEPRGIFPRGVVNFDGDGPLLAGGMPARSVVLLGNVGGSIWEPFSRWRLQVENIALQDPLDDWSKAVIRPLATRFGATAYFPSDPPWQPFQQWAMRAEGLRASPLGILIHPEYGLWHGYRGALGFAVSIDGGPQFAADHPCDGCAAKPCLSSCPADAVTSEGFNVAGCRSHLRAIEGRAGCIALGCMARAACPVGAAFRYPPAQLAFHMAALSL
jgi:ferredoxin